MRLQWPNTDKEKRIHSISWYQSMEVNLESKIEIETKDSIIDSSCVCNVFVYLCVVVVVCCCCFFVCACVSEKRKKENSMQYLER